MEIILRDTKKLIPYERNTKKHDAKQVENIANSISRFGWQQPIVVDDNGVVVIGHGRLMAAKKLGLKQVPVTVASGLTENELRELRIADNKTNESDWDVDLLADELPDLDFEGFDFEFDLRSPIDDSEDDDEGYYGDERERTNKAYNLDLVSGTALTNDFWQMPIIRNNNHIPNDLIGFNYAKTSDNKAAGIHFYVDDYQFERLWNAPDKYIDVLSEYDCILSPDFSLYMDMPMATKIWNIYRSRQIGAYYQSMGLTVIPTISWAEPETFEFCFKGIPKGSIVSISTVGVKEDKKATQVWRDGVDETPQVLDDAAFNKYLSDNNIPQSQLLARTTGGADYTVNGVRVRLSSNQVTDLIKYGVLNYVGGKHGGQVYGAGTYFDQNGGSPTGYGGGNTSTMVAALSKNAKTITLNDLRSRTARWVASHPKFARAVGGFDRRNASIYALAQGYNVITSGHGYHNVIDRSAIVVRKRNY